jgi:7-cyano-7-deazaguanine synthase
MDIYDKSDSPLLRDDSNIAGGEEGAEFAHEWVPARNIVMLSIATAYAEAKGFDYIVLGNNLEEAGAYPDNEPEFINRFNDLLPFAVGDGKRVRVVMPVGNLMKHEIVDLGHRLGAPLDLTWSCYRAGDKHCGTCGPCFMRRTAFEINNLEEVIEYEI